MLLSMYRKQKTTFLLPTFIRCTTPMSTMHQKMCMRLVTCSCFPLKITTAKHECKSATRLTTLPTDITVGTAPNANHHHCKLDQLLTYSLKHTSPTLLPLSPLALTQIANNTYLSLEHISCHQHQFTLLTTAFDHIHPYPSLQLSNIYGISVSADTNTNTNNLP